MPDEILMKIKYLCKAIPKVEWSGILLYDVKGTIKDPKNMVIMLKDIIPMNMGSQAYTEYNFNEKKRDTSGYDDKHIDYCMQNDNALDWKIGHIHSHNTMNVFFSGTDMSELDDNSASHNYYLSLIVNNWMDFCAKVAFRVTTETTVNKPYLGIDEDGNSYKVSDAELKVKKQKLYIYDCDIQSPKDKIIVEDNFFTGAVKDIVDKSKKPVYNNTNTPVTTYKPYMTSQNGFQHNKSITNANIVQKPSDVAKDIINDIPFADLADMHFDEELSVIDEFTITVLRGTNPPDEQVNSIELALEELDAFKDDKEVTVDTICSSIIENYPVLFDKYFENADDQEFIDTTSELIEVLEEYESMYEFLSKTIMALKYMLYKYEEQHGTTV